MNTAAQSRLVHALDSFNRAERSQALAKLAANAHANLPEPCARVNLHIHSFFSYNARGYSPSHIAWEACRQGVYAVGLCDFDVLDGLEEFLAAGLTLGLRVTVNLETRAFLSEYAQVDINSPGEPGVVYIMGAGFARQPRPGTSAALTLEHYSAQAAERNSALVARINARVPEIAVDYEKEVKPLSPGQCPTERHIVSAYREKASAHFSVAAQRFDFWARLMKAQPAEVEAWEREVPVIEEKIRSTLVKRGGLGYERTSAQKFPPVKEFIAWVRECQALPMVTWLDGTSAGEANAPELLECLRAQGACALNIIPERNHNIADPSLRAVKLQKLAEIVAAAEKLQFPINIGTEMNRNDQPFVDDTSIEVLKPYQAVFLRGARLMVGQTLLTRYANFSYVGPATESEFGTDLHRKNALFEAVGSLPPCTSSLAEKLNAMGPEKALACLRDSARRGGWFRV
ncbi:MAG: hypothetical protein HYV36_03310 [Lentisphaerae bacterium]|nr:hypothetical protein [Lentisphaerota bacterium]